MDLRECPLPAHRAIKWLNRWYKSHPEVNPEALTVIIDRIEIIVERGRIYADFPSGLSDIMDRLIKQYNGIMYDVDGVMMEIDLFTDEVDEDPYLFGLGDSPFFIEYLIEHHPEVLV